jgi:uncharacterized protein
MLSKLVLNQVIVSQFERLKKLNIGLIRQFNGYENLQSHAFIISGIRRCGKSTLLHQIMESRSFEKAIFLNFEDPRLSGFDSSDFNRLAEIAMDENITTYYFDEIQVVDKWETFVRFRLDEGDRVFITGSNSSMLSRELGTKLTGRHIQRELFPFSYSEYLEFMNQNSGENSLEIYLKSGGFPLFLSTMQEEILMQGFNDIIIRDIAVRYNIKNTTLLTQLAIWMVSNVGKLVTGNSLRKIFNIASTSSISDYLAFFSDSYMFFFVPRFSYSYKAQIVNPKKIYCIDNGFITTNSVSFSDDLGRLLENTVFLHLRFRTSEIYYFNEGKECDFVVYKNGKLDSLIQVCYNLDSYNTDREIEGLNAAMNFFNVKNGLIITYNQNDHFVIEDKNIDVVAFFDWAK